MVINICKFKISSILQIGLIILIFLGSELSYSLHTLINMNDKNVLGVFTFYSAYPTGWICTKGTKHFLDYRYTVGDILHGGPKGYETVNSFV